MIAHGQQQQGRSLTFAESQIVEARDSVMGLVRDDSPYRVCAALKRRQESSTPKRASPARSGDPIACTTKRYILYFTRRFWGSGLRKGALIPDKKQNT